MLTQELRQTVKEINNPPPQPEDPERSLDPDSQEDRDLCVELIDGVFHQLSKDNTLVAITTDYPGLLPASKVSRDRSPGTSKETLLGKGMLVAHRICLLMAHYWCATGITPLELNSNGALLVRH